jgi:hypothetical protein
VALLEVSRRERTIGLAMLLAALGFIVSLNLLNVDAFIVRQNIQREVRSTTDKAFAAGRADLDVQYFLGLSEDAVPPLVSAYRSKSIPVAVKDKVGAALACKQYDRRQQEERTIPWQGFHVARWKAEVAFAEVRQELSDYKIIDADWPVRVKAPGGDEFPCYQDNYD